MNSYSDLKTMSTDVPVLCIPRVRTDISTSRIRKIISDLKIGELERIDVVSKTTLKGEQWNRVFIHYRSWNDSENANIVRERILNGKDIKIIYDEPWFWKISAYREPNRKTILQTQNSNSELEDDNKKGNKI